jgi:TPR repeat protein
MMYNFDPIISRCPACESLLERFELLSGNTFGATFWTDGKVDAPDLPDQPPFGKCSHCKAIVWVIDLKPQIDQVKTKALKDRVKADLLGLDDLRLMKRAERNSVETRCGHLIDPDLEELLGYVDRECSDIERERIVRAHAWKKGNDSRRTTSDKKPLATSERANLEKLCPLIDESNDNLCLLKAEALRELGRFDAARSVLQKVTHQDLAHQVQFITRLIDRFDTAVREVPPAPRKPREVTKTIAIADKLNACIADVSQKFVKVHNADNADAGYTSRSEVCSRMHERLRAEGYAKAAWDPDLSWMQNLVSGLRATDQPVGALKTVGGELCELLNCQRLSFYRFFQPEASLYPVFSTNAADFKHFNGSLLGYSVSTGRTLNIPDADDGQELARLDPYLKFLDAVDGRTGLKTRQVLVTPVLCTGAGNKVTGAIQMMNSLDHQPFVLADELQLVEFARLLEPLNFWSGSRQHPGLATRPIGSPKAILESDAYSADAKADFIAAKDGNAKACHRYGTRLDQGDGVPQDSEEAWRCYTQAAMLGDAGAPAVAISQMFLEGRGGDARSLSEAVTWLIRAGRYGHPEALRMLGITQWGHCRLYPLLLSQRHFGSVPLLLQLLDLARTAIQVSPISLDEWRASEVIRHPGIDLIDGLRRMLLEILRSRLLPTPLYPSGRIVRFCTACLQLADFTYDSVWDKEAAEPPAQISLSFADVREAALRLRRPEACKHLHDSMRNAASGTPDTWDPQQTWMQNTVNGLLLAAAPGELLPTLGVELCALLNCERLSVFRIKETGAALSSVFSTGLEGFGALIVPINGRSLAGYSASTGKTLNIADAYDDAELARLDPNLKFLSEVDKRTGYKTKQVLVTPVMDGSPGNKVAGAIQILNSLDQQPFVKADELQLVEFAGLFAQTRLLERIRFRE